MNATDVRLPQLQVDGGRVVGELDELARFSDTPPPAVTRVVFSEADRHAREYLDKLYREAGLEVRVDPVGNVFARWAGSQSHLPVVGTGSHTDAIPHSGRYDGTVGVLGGLEAIRSLRAAGFRPRRSIELLMFTSEEPTRYGIGCLGSRLLTGSLEPTRAAGFKDNEGVTLERRRSEFGCGGTLSQVQLPADYYRGFVELHIEQGPILEREGLPVGIVEAIAAPASLRCNFTGEGGHAGAVLMPDRRDAFLGAADLAVEVERTALTLGGPDTVATMGYVKLHPCAVNSIPSQVEAEIDVRDVDGGRRDVVLQAIWSAAESIASRRNLHVQVELINADPPAVCDRQVVAAAAAACDFSGLKHRRMISRAYHDSLFMALVSPTAMIFIPCYKGYSHRPDEFASPEAIRGGVEVLARTLATLSHAD